MARHPTGSTSGEDDTQLAESTRTLLAELRAFMEVVRDSSTLERQPNEQPEFEERAVRPAYARAAQALNAWAKQHGYPLIPSTYASRHETFNTISDVQNGVVRELPRRALKGHYRRAAAATCWLWAARRLGDDLVAGLFGDPRIWRDCHVPVFSYCAAMHLPDEMWPIAEGISDDVTVSYPLLLTLMRRYGDKVLTVEWLRRRCRDAEAEGPGEHPSLPLALWAASSVPDVHDVLRRWSIPSRWQQLMGPD